MFLQLQNKKVSRIYRNFYNFEKLEQLNMKYNIGLSEIGIKRFITSMRNKSFVFGDNQGSKLCFAMIDEIMRSVYSDCEIVTRDESFVKIRQSFKSCKWYVREHKEHTIIGLGRVDDQAFIDLLRKLDNSGTQKEFCDWVRYVDYDVHMSERISKFNIGDERKRNDKYWQTASKLRRKRAAYRNDKATLSEVKLLEDELNKLTSKDMMDPLFKRLRYIRVGTEVLYGIIGSKADAKQFGKPIHHDNFVEWHGTKMSSKSTNAKKVMSDGRRGRYTHGSVRFYIDENILAGDLANLGYTKNYKARARTNLVHCEPEVLIHKAKQEINMLYDKYRRCTNVSLLQSAWYVIEYSLYLTLGMKYNASIAKLKKKYSRNGCFTINNVKLRKPKFKVKKHCN